MSIINVKDRTINAKVVYYGTALGGKTTSLKHVHRVIDPAQNVELVSLNTESDRTLFFDFLPISLGKIGGFTVSIQGFTVPGQVRYNLTRKYVLTGADAVVMVIDSRRSQLEKNIEAFENLKENLAANGLDYASIPIVIQYNKQDLDDLVPIAEMDRIMNDRGLRTYQTVATEGPGVFEAFTEVSRQMIDSIASRYQLGGRNVSIGDALAESLSRRMAGWSGIGPDQPAGGLVQIGDDDGGDHELMDGSEELLRQAVGTNIEIARLYSEVNEMKNRLRSRVGELTELNDLGRSLTTLLNVNELLPTVLESASRCLGTEHASLLLLSRDGTNLEEEALQGFLWDPLTETLSPDEPPSKLLESARRGNGLLIDEERNVPILRALRQKEQRIVSAIVAPLMKQQEVVGLIAVYFLDKEQDGLRDKLRFLSALASHASVALENARLVTRIEGFNRELEQTVRDRTAELRQAYEELKELDRLKDDFLSSMSHELLTPLTSICSFSEILLTTEPGSSDSADGAETRAEFLGIIHGEAGRLTNRLKTLLDLSQLEGGQVRLERAELDAADLLTRCVEEFRPAARARDIDLEVVCPAPGTMVAGDPAWLGRAVMQVVGNAVKFSDEGGRVTAALKASNGMIDLIVTDEGPGIAPEFQESIFERFKQLGEILTTKPKGVGLGLPLARRILDDHGGRISVTSEPGRGAKFVLSIPAAGEGRGCLGARGGEPVKQ